MGLVGDVFLLAFAVVEKFRTAVCLEDIDAPEEELVGHEESFGHTRIIGGQLLKREPYAW